jgi:hypothetical protein
MARTSLLVGTAALALSLVGCAGHTSRTASDADSPSASVSDQLRSLVGRWQGTLAETGAFYYQGTLPVDVTLRPDGTWGGTIGNAKATGTASMQGRRLVLSGTARSSTGHEDPVYLALTGDESRRWGATLGRFAGREERASVSLEKTS